MVRIHAAGVCGTDLHILDGMIKPDPYPMTLGHESAGVVEAVGDEVSLRPGDRVAVYNKIYCGHCEQCLKGRPNICDNEPDELGFNRDGGDAEYVVGARTERRAGARRRRPRDRGRAHVRGHDGDARHQALDLRVADTAVVDGIGGVGTRGSGRRPRRRSRHRGGRFGGELRLARDHGASDGSLVATPEAYDDLATGGPRADRGPRHRRVLRARGYDAFDDGGCTLAREGRRFVSTGYTDQQIEVHPIEFILPESSLISTVAATRLDLQDALALAAAGAMTVPIARSFPLEAVSDALAALRRRGVLGRQVLEIA